MSSDERALPLIESIYASAVEPGGWKRFAHDLSDAFGRAAVAISMPHPDSERPFDVSRVHLRDDMEAGRVDLAIGLLPQLQAGFYQRRLFLERYVCLFRRGHPLDAAKAALADFLAAEHLVVVSADTGHGKVDEMMRRAGVDRFARLTVPHFVGVGHILQATNLVATVPQRLARRLVEPFGLTYRPHPVPLPEVAINVFWHAKMHRSPANQWLRGVVFELFTDEQSSPGPGSGD